MPLYKVVGNTILTRAQNLVVGEHLSEWHSGYRAYSVATLAELPFERLSPDYNFDTQIILALHEARKRIVELPIPTFYGDEISYVNGLRYARQCAVDVVRYRLEKMGLGRGELAFNSPLDEPGSSSAGTELEGVAARVVDWFARRPPQRVLDLGCGDGELAARLRAQGHAVTGVDAVKRDGVAARVTDFVEADLDEGLPAEVGEAFDVVLAADLVGFLRRPERVLVDAARRLRPGGRLLVSTPNFANWYPRARVAAGRFDYDRRGILDRGHLRFFTRHSALATFDEAGLVVTRSEPVGLPVQVLSQRSSGAPRPSRMATALAAMDRVGVRARPDLFAFQFLFELEPSPRG